MVGLKGVEVDWQLRDGRMVPVNREGTDYEVQADMVLLALGFVGPGRNTLADAQRLEKDARGNICVNEQHQASQENIFASGGHGQWSVAGGACDCRWYANGGLYSGVFKTKRRVVLQVHPSFF